jgi:CubicO group peptidase (beta-lactamase class C family)
MVELIPQVDRVFEAWDKTVSPGCALAIVKDNEIIYKRGYGMANLEYGVPISPSTIFHIASVSKQFAAMAVTLLAHEGKLSLEDEVRQYVPEMPDFGEKITIRHLIHHTSGIRDQWEMVIMAGWRMDDVITTDDILDLLSKQRELNFKPGEKFLYCNTGYTLLGVIVKNVTGKSLREFCEERIFQPLGMHNTHFHDDHCMIVKNRAYSYTPAGYNQYRNAVLSYATVGATSLFTTVEDLALWDKEFYEANIFGKEVIEEMHSQGLLNNGEKTGYAHGLMIRPYRGLNVVEHSGGDSGFRTHLMRFPEQHFSVIIFSNLSTVSPGELAKKIADLYLADEFTEEITPEEVIKLSEEELQSFAGLYLGNEGRSSVTIEIRDGKLFADIGPGLELEPLSNQRLKVKQFPGIKIERKLDEDQSEHLYLITGAGKPDQFERVKRYIPTAEDLEQCAGKYFSPELEVTYMLSVKDGKMWLKRRKYGSQEMKPIIKDVFEEKMLNIHFARDPSGNISGFKASSGRILDLEFVKQ